MLIDTNLRFLTFNQHVCGYFLMRPTSILTEIIATLRQTVSWRDFSVLTQDSQNIILRVYRPKLTPSGRLPVYLFFHGGGHLFGAVETEDSTCCRIIAGYQSPGVIVVHVNYRHTPEFTYPTQFQDAWDSYKWLADNIDELGGDPERVVVGGISAGAGLACSLALRCAGFKTAQKQTMPLIRISGLVLCIPWLILHVEHRNFIEDREKSSISQNVDAPILPVELLSLFSNLLEVGKCSDRSLVDLTAASDEVITRLPRASFLIAGRDPLRDDGLHFADKLKRNGSVLRQYYRRIITN